MTELKGFKYQIALAVLLSKIKTNGEIEYSPVYFNYLTKTVRNNNYKLDYAFQEIIYRLEIGLVMDLVGLLKKYKVSL